jgi:hypothetical protein
MKPETEPPSRPVLLVVQLAEIETPVHVALCLLKPGPETVTSHLVVGARYAIIHYVMNMRRDGPPLWSSGQSSWLQIRRPGFDTRHYQKKK